MREPTALVTAEREVEEVMAGIDEALALRVEGLIPQWASLLATLVVIHHSHSAALFKHIRWGLRGQRRVVPKKLIHELLRLIRTHPLVEPPRDDEVVVLVFRIRSIDQE